MEVARVELDAPHHFVDLAELGDGERRLTEGGGQVRVLELGPGPLDAVGEDGFVVKGQGSGQIRHRDPPGVTGIASRLGDRQVGRQQQVGHGDHPAPGVPVGFAVGAELLEMSREPFDAGLFGQLPIRRRLEVFVFEDETARQGPAPFMGWQQALDDEGAQCAVPHGQDHQIDGHGHGRHLEGRSRRCVGTRPCPGPATDRFGVRLAGRR